MDGLYAVFFLISTLISSENPLANGFNQTEVNGYNKVSFASVEFQNRIVGNEIQYSYYLDNKLGPLQPTYSISVTDQGGFWGGAGFIRKVRLIDYVNFNFDFSPGIYIRGNEEDLGGWLMFRSGVEIEFIVNDFLNMSIGYDHRSSGDLWKYNPGMETLKFSISKKY